MPDVRYYSRSYWSHGPQKLQKTIETITIALDCPLELYDKNLLKTTHTLDTGHREVRWNCLAFSIPQNDMQASGWRKEVITVLPSFGPYVLKYLLVRQNIFTDIIVS